MPDRVPAGIRLNFIPTEPKNGGMKLSEKCLETAASQRNKPQQHSIPLFIDSCEELPPEIPLDCRKQAISQALHSPLRALTSDMAL
jgi:hypothetical protein